MKPTSTRSALPTLLLPALLLVAGLAHAQQPVTPPPLPDAPGDWAAEPAQSPAPTTREYARVRLNDGQELRGRIISRDSQMTTLELTTGARLNLPSSSIQSVTVEKGVTVSGNEVWLSDSNRTRYLYGPSAMMLKQGEGYFSQKELIFSSASVGLTDNLSILAGGALPAWAVPGGFNFIFALKGGFSVNQNFHLAAGAETLVLPSVGGFGFVFATATAGNPVYHATISVGHPFAFSFSNGGALQNVGDVIVVVSGNVRIAQSFALVTENWIFPNVNQSYNDPFPLMLNSLALRCLIDRWTLDIGAIRAGPTPFPVPWLDVAYHWG